MNAFGKEIVSKINFQILLNISIFLVFSLSVIWFLIFIIPYDFVEFSKTGIQGRGTILQYSNDSEMNSIQKPVDSLKKILGEYYHKIFQTP